MFALEEGLVSIPMHVVLRGGWIVDGLARMFEFNFFGEVTRMLRCIWFDVTSEVSSFFI